MSLIRTGLSYLSGIIPEKRSAEMHFASPYTSQSLAADTCEVDYSLTV